MIQTLPISELKRLRAEAARHRETRRLLAAANEKQAIVAQWTRVVAKAQIAATLVAIVAALAACAAAYYSGRATKDAARATREDYAWRKRHFAVELLQKAFDSPEAINRRTALHFAFLNPDNGDKSSYEPEKCQQIVKRLHVVRAN